MDVLSEPRRRAFSAWLRTGRLPGWMKTLPAEFKFNPWHDPDSGRFTFAGAGQYFGQGGSRDNAAAHSDRRPPSERVGKGGRSGGGGATGRNGGGRSGGSGASGTYGGGRSGGGGATGSYGGRGKGFNGGGASGTYSGGRSGGGGATGSWDVPAPAANPQPKPATKPGLRRNAKRSTQVRPGISPSIAQRAADENWQRVERNGYTYLIDREGRTRHVSGVVATNDAQSRSRSAQSRAGGEDRRATDHGGHYIARRFNGPTEAFNHFAQDANFNRGGYLALENQWARALRAGKRVEVKLEPVYKGSSQRPSRINVWFWIDGKPESLQFPNAPQETSRAER